MLQLTKNEARAVYAALKYLRDYDASTTNENELFEKVKEYLEAIRKTTTN